MPLLGSHLDQGRRPRGEIYLRTRGAFHSRPDVSTALALRSTWQSRQGVRITCKHDVHPLWDLYL